MLKLVWNRLSRIVLTAFRFWFEFRKSLFRWFSVCFLFFMLNVVWERLSLSFIFDCRFRFEFGKLSLRWFCRRDYRIRTRTNYEQLWSYTVSAYRYSRRVPTSTRYSTWLCTNKSFHHMFAFFRAAHYESCSSRRIELRNICHVDISSPWEVLISGEWIQGLSSMRTQVNISWRRSCWVRHSTSPSRLICYFILNSEQTSWDKRLTI